MTSALPREWKSPAAAAAILMMVYLGSMAPGVTFWDAGEFIAAIQTLGIPHPPGTPLFILIGRTWTLALGFIEPAFALNLLSAVCTTAAGAITAHLVFRSTHRRSIAVAAAVIAGTMSTAWMNATETEVYALSLLLSLLIIDAADQAGLHSSWRWVVLTGYLVALAVPLHLTALVAAPAAIVLASEPGPGVAGLSAIAPTRLSRLTGNYFPRWRWPWALALLAVAILAVAASSASVWLAAVGIILLVVSLSMEGQSTRWKASSLLAAVAIACTALAFMIVRAPHDPGINQGDPSTIARWLAVMTREQYEVVSLWPRQSPPWIQFGNMLQYFDWQLALALAPEPPLSFGRGMITLAGIALGIAGSGVHRRTDPRRWRAVLALLLSGSIGVMLYLNLKAGPSIGWGVLPESAPHEPRERDYFFVLAFWAWGIWIAMGVAEVASRAMTLLRRAPANARRIQLSALALVALVPVVLNWSAVERRSEPSASMPRRAAQALLASAPERAVLFVAGDNDSYPLWYLQHVERFRPDVAVITIPIIPADWYRAEVERRHGLRSPAKWAGLVPTMTAMASDARRQHRPVVAAVSITPSERAALGDLSVLRGWLWVESDSLSLPLSLRLHVVDPGQAISDAHLAPDDRAALVRLADPISAATWQRLGSTERYMASLLACPRFARESGTRKAAADSLDSTCNFR